MFSSIINLTSRLYLLKIKYIKIEYIVRKIRDLKRDTRLASTIQELLPIDVRINKIFQSVSRHN